MQQNLKLLILITLLTTILFPQSKLHIKGQPKKSSSEIVGKRDANGDFCAAIKVVSDMDGFSYDAYNGVVEVDDQPGKDMVYLSTDERVLEVFKSGYEPMKIILSEVGIQLEEKAVWEIKITGDEKITEVPVVITANQNGAKVFIDGKSVGKIEDGMLTANIGTGDHTIKIQKDGYATQQVEENISLDNNSFNFKLEEQMPAVVSIKTEPEGAKVYIDGLLIGTTPVDNFYDEGTYPIRIVKENYETVEETITITEPETKKAYNLNDIRATLTVNTHPNATVKFNGQSYKGGVSNMRIAPQVLKVEVDMPKAEPLERSITLRKNGSQTVEMYPEVATGTIQIITIPTNAKIELNGDAGEHYTAIGRKTFSDVPVGEYELIAKTMGYRTYKEVFLLKEDESVKKQITLTKGNDFINSINTGVQNLYTHLKFFILNYDLGANVNLLPKTLGGFGNGFYFGSNYSRISFNYYKLDAPEVFFQDGFEKGRIDKGIRLTYDYFNSGNSSGLYYSGGLQYTEISASHINTTERGKWKTYDISIGIGYLLYVIDYIHLDLNLGMDLKIPNIESMYIGNNEMFPSKFGLFGCASIGFNL